MLRYANLQLLWAWLPFCFDLLVPVTDQLGLVQSVYYPPGFGVLCSVGQKPYKKQMHQAVSQVVTRSSRKVLWIAVGRLPRWMAIAHAMSAKYKPFSFSPK